MAASRATAAGCYPARVRINAANVAEGQFRRVDLLAEERAQNQGAPWEWMASRALAEALVKHPEGFGG